MKKSTLTFLSCLSILVAPVVSRAEINWAELGDPPGTMVSSGTQQGSPRVENPNDISRISIAHSGSSITKADSREPSVSADGRYIAFSSSAEEIVALDNNQASDVFLHDRETKKTIRISLNKDGREVKSPSVLPKISASGNFVAFQSNANLDAADKNTASDIYLYNVTNGTINLISRNALGASGDAGSFAPTLSANAEFVAFSSDSTNIVGNNNKQRDIFLYSDSSGLTKNLTQFANGFSDVPSISSDGKQIAFHSAASNLVSADTNKHLDVFLYNADLNSFSLISKNASDLQGNGDSRNPSFSANGAFIVYETEATNIAGTDSKSFTDIVRYDINNGTSLRVSQNKAGFAANGRSIKPVISADGRYVAFLSDATNLVEFDSNNKAGDGVFDVFVKDLTDNSIVRINRSIADRQAKGTSDTVSISADASVAAFDSNADSLVQFDQNHLSDVFVVDKACKTDSDQDNFPNCIDHCPLDKDKSDEGQCGCGVVDTDSDQDNIADCKDLCPTDTNKSAPGRCGCGLADSDLDGDGTKDCLQVTANTVPLKIVASSIRRRILVKIPSQFAGVKFEVVVMKGKKVIAKKITTDQQFSFDKIAKGKYTIQYRVIRKKITSKFSVGTKVVV